MKFGTSTVWQFGKKTRGFWLVGKALALGAFKAESKDNRHSRAETAPQIDAMLVSPDTLAKGGGPHVFGFLICAFASEL